MLLHELIGKVRINPLDKPFGAIAHPYINNIGAHVFLAFGRKRMAQIVLRCGFVTEYALKNSVEYVCPMLYYRGILNIGLSPCFSANGGFSYIQFFRFCALRSVR